jgi:hypothetical protein
MTIVIVLLALSAATGLALGASFNWYAIPISSPPLALLSAAVLQMAGFGAPSGIATVVACLTVKPNCLRYYRSGPGIHSFGGRAS